MIILRERSAAAYPFSDIGLLLSLGDSHTAKGRKYREEWGSWKEVVNLVVVLSLLPPIKSGLIRHAAHCFANVPIH
jgi:hypothetical protein